MLGHLCTLSHNKNKQTREVAELATISNMFNNTLLSIWRWPVDMERWQGTWGWGFAHRNLWADLQTAQQPAVAGNAQFKCDFTVTGRSQYKRCKMDYGEQAQRWPWKWIAWVQWRCIAVKNKEVSSITELLSTTAFHIKDTYKFIHAAALYFNEKNLPGSFPTKFQQQQQKKYIPIDTWQNWHFSAKENK